MSPRAKATAPRPLPTMADGSVPRAEQRVVTADGLPGVIVWSTYVPGHEVWETLVMLDKGVVRSVSIGNADVPVADDVQLSVRFRTDTLRQEPS